MNHEEKSTPVHIIEANKVQGLAGQLFALLRSAYEATSPMGRAHRRCHVNPYRNQEDHRLASESSVHEDWLGEAPCQHSRRELSLSEEGLSWVCQSCEQRRSLVTFTEPRGCLSSLALFVALCVWLGVWLEVLR